MSISLDELIQSVADNTISSLIHGTDNVSVDLAKEAKALYVEASGRGDAQLAFLAALGASLVWRKLGDEVAGVRNFINALQMKYMSDEESDEYLKTRGDLIFSKEKALDLREQGLAFRAGRLAADCGFWASEAADHPKSDTLLLQTLDDLMALKDLANTDDKFEFEQFVSLLSAAGTTAAERFMGFKGSEENEKVRTFVEFADEIVPFDFSYEISGDADKTAHTANALAKLSEIYAQ